MKATSELMKGFMGDCFFDWYQVTFAVKMLPDWFVHQAREQWDFLDVDQVSPRFKTYQHAINLKRGDRVYCHVCWGGVNEGLHVVSTGSIAHEVALWLQSKFKGKYGVSRADVRMDTLELGMWDYLYRRCKDVGEERNVRRHSVGDWDVEGSPSGRTYYLGSDKSAVKTRLYEKGKKEKGNPLWLRLEIEVRPSKFQQKLAASHWSPVDFWKSSAWSNYLYGAVMYRSEKVDSQAMGTVWSASNHDRAVMSMINQYGATLEKIAGSIPGGWAGLGDYLLTFKQTMIETKKATAGYGESPYEEVLSKYLSVGT